MKATLKALVAASGLTASVTAATVDTGWINWSQANGGNNHAYRLIVFEDRLSWGEAAVEAAGLRAGSHLATLTAREENDFVFDLIKDAGARAWLGGVQVGNPPDPRADWEWITGETWSFTNWAPGQPGVDRAQAYLNFNLPDNGWDDEFFEPSGNINALVAEVVPAPATGWLLAALAGLGIIRLRHRSGGVSSSHRLWREARAHP